MVSTEIEKLEKKIQKQEEKIKAIEEKMKPLQKKIKILEDYALANHHKWSREKIFKESQKLTGIYIELDEWEAKYNREKLEMSRAKGRLKEAKGIVKE